MCARFGGKRNPALPENVYGRLQNQSNQNITLLAESVMKKFFAWGRVSRSLD
jgi:hypothetical protein